MNKQKRIRIYGAVIGIVLLLICIRAALPHFALNYVNKVLDDVEGYSGSVEDVDLHLYRGAYKIENLRMVKETEDLPVPFIDIAAIDLSIQWAALFQGSIVGEIELSEPTINFAFEESEEQTGEETDWTQPIKELMPLQINRFSIKNGVIAYKDFASSPKVDIALENIDLEALNLSNSDNSSERLPSNIKATAISIGEGTLTLECDANILKRIPDIDLNMEFENVSLPALNDFTNAYARLDFENGVFNLYTEMAITEGILTGYVKPILTDIDVLELPEEDDTTLEIIWEGIAGAVISIFTNQPSDQFATQAPIEGDLNDPEIQVWPTIGNVFKNAFIEAFNMETDDSVSFDDITE